MLDTNNHTPRMLEDSTNNACLGQVRWAPKKSTWYLSNLLVAIVGGVLTFSLSAFLVFLVFTAVTLCLGHSLGMHRRLIHNSYECPLWLEYFFVHLGVLVGMAGPYGMIEQHDLRDWAQRKANCHAYLRHGSGFWKDGWWQLCCDIYLDQPPKFRLEERIATDPVYRFMEKYWMAQQLPWAVILFTVGGTAFVVWGICARVAVSVTGHWLVGYFAHNQGMRDWEVKGAAVQGHNVPLTAYLTMGENWHNNHHAYPGSAMLGLYKDQPDPGWWVLNRLYNVGLVWSIRLPEDLPARPELSVLNTDKLTSGRRRTLKTCGFLRHFT